MNRISEASPVQPSMDAPVVLRLPHQLTVQHTPHPLAGLEIAVVGINYAPEPTGVAPYTTGMCRHLADVAGHVIVLTGVPHYPSWTTPEAFRRRRRIQEQQHPHLEVLRHWHHVPARQTALTRGLYETTFLANVAATRLRRRPDLILGVTPSLGGAAVAARMAERYGVPLVIVVQDLMARAAGQSGIRGGGRVASATAKLEAWALRSATRVAIVSEAFRDAVVSYGVPDERVEILPNWTHISPAGMDVAAARRALGWPLEGFLAIHTGNMGLKQDLANVIEAARALPDRHAQVVLVGDGSQREALRRLAEGVPNVRFVDPVSDADYPRVLAAADVLLVNERPSVCDMSLPSKLTSYLSAGRAVVAAVAPGGATDRELTRTDGAAVCVEAGKPVLLARELEALREDPARRERMGAAGRRFADEMLGERAAMDRLDALLGRALAG